MGEALVVCSERNMGAGMTVWDLTTGDHLLHIPTCASNPHGMICLTNTNHHFLFASQIHRHGSLGGGSIFTWSLTKPQTPLRSYPLEAIGPLSCTKDGAYLSGGALSGNAYIWEVASGKLLKTWRAHLRCLTCMMFSGDGSLLVFGSEDGVVSVWSMISLLDVDNCVNSPSLLHRSSEHCSSITGLSTTSGSSSPMLVSSSLDGTFKVSDLVLGRVLHTMTYPLGITASVLHPTEQLVFCGSLDGRIFITNLDNCLINEPDSSVSKAQPVELKGHNGAITALAIGRSGLISASEDCTVCVWDALHWTVTQRFNHKKGPVSNLAVIPRSLLSSATSNRRASTKFRISPLEKYPKPLNPSKETITLLSSTRSSEENRDRIDGDNTSTNRQALNAQLQKEWTLEAMEMRAETSLEKRRWAMKMAKHVMEMNRHLQSRLLDMMHVRLQRSSVRMKKRKALVVNDEAGPTLQKQNQ